jgi:spore coat polysaccharide biosynthesis protein SpsF
LIGCIIQARTGSTRLPQKILENLDKNNTVLDYVLAQISESELIDKVVIATTTLPEDDVIENQVKKLGFDVFRGDPNDVLDRYYECAKKFNFKIIVRITSDCPLIDPEITDNVIGHFNSEKYDYVCNTQPRTFPQGTETEVFSFTVLHDAWKNSKLQSEREHVTAFFYNNPEKFRILNVKNDKDLSNLRWCIDRKEDLDVLKNIVSKTKKRPILTKHILEIIKSEPEIFEKNKHISIFEGYEKSLKNDPDL